MQARAPVKLLRPLMATPAVVPALVMVGILVTLGAKEGGIVPTTWYTAALFALALLMVALATVPAETAIPRTILVAIALFGAYAALSYLSITWADDRGVAFDGANQTLLYVVVFSLFALWPMRPAAGAVVLAAFGFGVAALGLVTLLRASSAADASAYFIDGRFIEPVGYQNGTVALFSLGLLACALLAARRELPAAVRGAALGAAGLLGCLALLGQSRGWLFSLPVVVVLMLSIAPGRGRNALALIAVAGSVVAASSPLLEVRNLALDGDVAAALGDATRAILLASAALAMLGTVAALVDRATTLSPARARRVSAAVVAAVAVAAVAAITAVAVAANDPAARISDAWREFKAADEATEGTSRLTSSLASNQNRYDYWRVAWSQFETDPLIGAGVDNFQQDYLERGRSGEQPLYPHSLEVRVVSQTGVLGALLLGATLAAALVAGLRAARPGNGLGSATAGAALVMFLYWVVHGSVDWFWEMPALGCAAFAMLGLAASLMPRSPLATERRPGAPIRGPLPVGALAVAGFLLLVVLGAPWLAQRHIDRAIEQWPTDPRAAFDRLERAADLNPLSTEPHITAATIALRLDQPSVAERELRAALDRNPRSAFAALHLGALASDNGDREAASALVERAVALNPLDPVTSGALEDLRAGRRLDPNALYQEALTRARERTE